MRFFAKSLLFLILFLAVPAFAQVQPPARVGRVSLISGTLAFYGPGDTDWSAAKINLPVATGAWLATDPQSRAEIRIGADSIDLSLDTQLNFAGLSDHFMQIALTQGRIDLRARHLNKDETAEIDIPRGGVWLLQPASTISKAAARISRRASRCSKAARASPGAVSTPRLMPAMCSW
jgi:hypothetical protein